ncbi:MAG: DegV family protein, partial [Anaerolineae bacterium]|nr:DegV family protein [Anaerolineae bacterium]
MTKKVRIVTDSTSDVPSGVAEQLHITVVPAYVQIGNQSYRDAPGGLSREDFYARLPTFPVPPTTAVPPAHEFAQVYRALSAEADEVITIVLATSLSGMYSVARLGAKEVPEVKVHVVDSGQITMGLGWMVIAAAEAAARGESAAEILAMLEQMKPRVRVYAALDTLEYLRRSGRVGWARARAAALLNIKPLIEVVEGKVRDAGRTRTRQRALDKLVELIRALGPLERLAIIHTCAPDLEEWRQRLSAFCSPEKLLSVGGTTVGGAHAVSYTHL